MASHISSSLRTPVLLEVIATTVDDARLAERGGADRIELITAFGEGGLTPSVGLIEAVVNAVSIPVNVMVRPHSRSFVYGQDDYRVMTRDVHAVVAAGANGVVTGMLDAAGEVDAEGLRRLIDAAEGRDVTFHRAFDEAADLPRALDVLMSVDGVSSVLTSGGASSVLMAVEMMRTLMSRAEGSGVTVLAGAGLTIDAVGAFVDAAGVRAVHFGSGVRGGAGAGVDADKVKLVRAALDLRGRH
ncbi:copper homeostasis protein CutC [Paraburkholderia sp.]|uniref:copper homeostasis protein CutC n=1 Tax=Paraburkholderia sp. TaxID=1926495 RepID=UPI00239EF5E0|nr:copper homeostasis protein CutC [Paraburkholderia sp.]MDE1181525.1 copper homeostasis protein CutC [Paraburkholderia sp.]